MPSVEFRHYLSESAPAQEFVDAVREICDRNGIDFNDTPTVKQICGYYIGGSLLERGDPRATSSIKFAILPLKPNGEKDIPLMSRIADEIAAAAERILKNEYREIQIGFDAPSGRKFFSRKRSEKALSRV